MSGETNLDTLLQNMQPVLCEGIYVFHSSDIRFEDAVQFDPVLIFRETEGTALILKKHIAEDAGLSYDYPSRMITLNVHSSLNAVGFLAAITTALAEEAISVNPVSAYYHDHLFVPYERADDAMQVLNRFATA